MLARLILTPLALFSAVTAAPAAQQPSLDKCNSIFAQQDVSAITTLANKINDEAKPIQENQIIKLLDLQSDVQKLISAVNTANSDAKAVCPQIDDVNQALTIAQPLLQLPTVVNATLTTIIDKKPVFDGAVLGLVSISWLVKGDLIKLNTSISNLETTLKGIFPAGLASIYNNVVGEINAPINNALQAYSETPLLNIHF